MSKSTKLPGADPPIPVSRQYRPLKFTGLLSDLCFIFKHPRSSIKVGRGKTIPPAFRERLMLAVIAVYGCRFCSWAHTGAALRSGMAEDEISGILIGSVDNCPPEEAIAVLYAQHWADSDGRPDHEAVERLEQMYDAETARVIDTILHIIRIGNYIGIGYERLLNRISFNSRGR